jgi:hypothetical protein
LFDWVIFFLLDSNNVEEDSELFLFLSLILLTIDNKLLLSFCSWSFIWASIIVNLKIYDHDNKNYDEEIDKLEYGEEENKRDIEV